MDYSEPNKNKHKIYKYTDENGRVFYVDENGNIVKRRKTTPAEHKSTPRSTEERNTAQRRTSERPSQPRMSDEIRSSERKRSPEEQLRNTRRDVSSAPSRASAPRHNSEESRQAQSKSRSTSKQLPAVGKQTSPAIHHSAKHSKKKKHGKKRGGCLKVFLIIIGILILIAAGLAIGVYITIIKSAPTLNTSDIVPSNYTSIIYDNNGTEIDKLHGDENREYVTFDLIPDDLKNAVISIEDERFYEHNGIDIKGIMRALVIDIKERNFSQGASTITQQLIKNEKLKSEKTIVRKIQEQYLAVKYEAELEKNLGSKKAAKDYILELYLNTIALNHGLNGVGSAAEFYFGKEVSELDLAECASIAGITKNPSKYSPISNPEENKKRQTTVLDKMLELGYITQSEHDSALAEDIYANLVGSTKDDEDSVALHSYFIDNLIVTLANDLMQEKNMTKQEAYNLIYSGGLQIYSTVDQSIQGTLEDAFMDDSLFPPSDRTYDATYTISVLNTETDEQEHHSESKTVSSKDQAEAFAQEVKEQYVDATHTMVLDNLAVSNSLQAAMVIIDYHTGEIKAIVGGRGQKSGDLVFNRATQAYRQPGSCFKVLAAYAPAIDSDLYSAGSFIRDEEYTVGDWSPRNWWTSGYRGYATVRDGIRDSMNILAAKVIVNVGIYNAYQYLLNFGFTSLDAKEDMNANISLGGLTEGVSVLELTSAYGTIANGGVYMKPTPYTKVLDHDGNVLLEYDYEGKRVLKETTAFLLTDMMEDVISGGGTGGLARFQSNRMPVAGKTGTTTDDKDLTFAGYTPYYVAGIWMGYDSPKKISYDKSYHLIVWRTVMDKLHDNLAYKEFEKPDGIITSSYCAVTNGIPISGVCANDYYGAGYYGNMVSTDYATQATAAHSECTAHGMYSICADSGKLAGPGCRNVRSVSLAVVGGQIVNRPSREECAKRGLLYIDLSSTCTENHIPIIGDDDVIGSDSNRDHGYQLDNITGNNSSDSSNNDSSSDDGHDIIIGAN